MLRIFKGWIRGASRKPLTGKTGPREYYKGKGCPNVGRLTSKGKKKQAKVGDGIMRSCSIFCYILYYHMLGKFIFDKSKLPQFVVPDMSHVTLKPYVARSVPKVKVPPITAQDFVNVWQQNQ